MNRVCCSWIADSGSIARLLPMLGRAIQTVTAYQRFVARQVNVAYLASHNLCGFFQYDGFLAGAGMFFFARADLPSAAP